LHEAAKTAVQPVEKVVEWKDGFSMAWSKEGVENPNAAFSKALNT
jgi:hypothetical protein